jgi:hypothetical protein
MIIFLVVLIASTDLNAKPYTIKSSEHVILFRKSRRRLVPLLIACTFFVWTISVFAVSHYPGTVEIGCIELPVYIILGALMISHDVEFDLIRHEYTRTTSLLLPYERVKGSMADIIGIGIRHSVSRRGGPYLCVVYWTKSKYTVIAVFATVQTAVENLQTINDSLSLPLYNDPRNDAMQNPMR